MLSHTELKKDNFLMELQDTLGKGMATLGTTLTSLAGKDNRQGDEPNPDLKALIASGKILCHVQHTISNHRKFLLNYHFNAKIQKIAASQNPDSLLFGEDFNDKCKNVKDFETAAKGMQAGPSQSKNFSAASTKTRWKTKATKQPAKNHGIYKKYRTNLQDSRRNYRENRGDKARADWKRR